MKTNVKTLLSLMLAACMILALAACGAGDGKTDESAAQKTEATEAPTSEATEAPTPAAETQEPASEEEFDGFRTLADAFAYDITDSSFSDYLYVCVFEKDGVYYRAVAELPEDVSEALWALDFFDDNYDELVRETVGPLEITQLDNLTEMIPSQEELDELVGKNVQELVDEGWYYWYWNLDDKELGMYYGPFSYLITFDGTPEDPENFDATQSSALTVRSVEYDGIGDAASEVIDAWYAEHSGDWTGEDFGELPPEDFEGWDEDEQDSEGEREWTGADFGEQPDYVYDWTGADFGEQPDYEYEWTGADFGEQPDYEYEWTGADFGEQPDYEYD